MTNEVVLPVSGGFARLERVKFSDLLACATQDNMILALILRCVTIDDRPVDEEGLDDLALPDALVVANLVAAQLEPLKRAKGVA